MEGPRIVFCDNSHIYDASIYSECPYCKKITEDQELLSSSVSGMRSVSNDQSNNRKKYWDASSEYEDGTELIQHNRYETDDQDETELLSKETDERTELLRHQSQIKADFREKNICGIEQYVLGWLVCLKGNNKGKSFEILSNSNNKL